MRAVTSSAMFSFGVPFTALCTASAAFSSTARHRCTLPRREIRVCRRFWDGVSNAAAAGSPIHKGASNIHMQIWHRNVEHTRDTVVLRDNCRQGSASCTNFASWCRAALKISWNFKPSAKAHENCIEQRLLHDGHFTLSNAHLLCPKRRHRAGSRQAAVHYRADSGGAAHHRRVHAYGTYGVNMKPLIRCKQQRGSRTDSAHGQHGKHVTCAASCVLFPQPQ
jgi:hypothetical protein